MELNKYYIIPCEATNHNIIYDGHHMMIGSINYNYMDCRGMILRRKWIILVKRVLYAPKELYRIKSGDYIRNGNCLMCNDITNLYSNGYYLTCYECHNYIKNWFITTSNIKTLLMREICRECAVNDVYYHMIGIFLDIFG